MPSLVEMMCIENFLHINKWESVKLKRVNIRV